MPNLSGSALRFSNSGGQARLLNPAGALVDTVVYEDGDETSPAGRGQPSSRTRPAAASPPRARFSTASSIASNGQPLSDTDSRTDWAQEPADPIAGRHVQYPGWDLERFHHPPILSTAGVLTVALAPDNVFDVVSQTLASAQVSIRIEGYSFEHVALAEQLAAKATAGVSVTLLLEGSPSGGLIDQERFVASASRPAAARSGLW